MCIHAGIPSPEFKGLKLEIGKEYEVSPSCFPWHATHYNIVGDLPDNHYGAMCFSPLNGPCEKEIAAARIDEECLELDLEFLRILRNA
jgi:hypothetical protein